MSGNKKRGTPCTIGQFAKLSTLIISALTGALQGINIKNLLNALEKNGEDLSRILREVFEDFLKRVNSPIFSSNKLKLEVLYHKELCDLIPEGISFTCMPSHEARILDVPITWIHFTLPCTTLHIMAEMEKKGFRPANYFELVAIGSYEYIGDDIFVALSATATKLDPQSIGYLAIKGRKCQILFCPAKEEWPAGTLFAVVKEG